MSDLLARLANQERTAARRTARPASDFTRLITCTACGSAIELFEATAGARTDDEHQWHDATTYVCTRCRYGDDT